MPAYKVIISDIRFWLLLFFALRLIGITDPPLEVAHNWRQTTVTMAARNFLEVDANILYPRIDFAGEKTGITGMEFPLLNYLIFLIAKVFGYAHWYGRLVNLIVSSFGIYFFYRLLLFFFSKPLAFKAALLLLVSVWFNYSRKIMPDTFSMSLLFMGIYYGLCYLLQNKGIRYLFLYVVYVLLGILSKLPSGYLLTVFAFVFVYRNISVAQRTAFVFANLLVLVGCGLYYFYWVPYLTQRYGFAHFFMGMSSVQGVKDLMSHPAELAEKFYLEALQIIGFFCFICGLVLAIVRKQKQMLYVLITAGFGFAVVMVKAGFGFYHHSYYIIPFAPVMALVAAYALDTIQQQKWAYLLLALIVGENLLNKFHDYHVKPREAAVLHLEDELNAFAAPTDLVLVNSGKVPTPIYFTHHKGWIASNDELLRPNFLDSLQQKGLKWIVVLKNTFGSDVLLPFPQMLDKADYRIYKCRAK